MNPFFLKLRSLLRRRRKEEDLRDELQFHLDEEAEERQSEGFTSAEARGAARRDIGNFTLVQEETRAVWTWTYLEQLAQDCRYGLRSMAANKAFSLLAILSLALGIGANTAIYSFMDSLLLRSLPVSHAESLAVLNWGMNPAGRDSVMRSMSGSTWSDSNWKETGGIFPFPAFELIRTKSTEVFSSVFAYYPTRKVNVMVKGQAEQASGEYVSGDYFRGLALAPAAGRLILPDDDRAGAPAIAVLSFPYGQRRFGDVTSAPGQSILINNVPFTVAGVAPPGFFGVDPASAPDFYIPLHTNLLLKQRFGAGDANVYHAQNYYWLEMMARLRPGVSHSQAQAALAPVFHQWVDSTAANDRERANLPQFLVREGATGLDTLRRRYSKPLYVLLAMVALILAIACANIASLLLARATARRREIAVRLSIGAGRFRVIRQLLTESMLLASIGGGAGVLFAIWGIRFLTFLLANGTENFTLHPNLNWNVLAAASALSLLTGLLFGLAPALQSTRVDVIPALKQARAGQTGPRHRFWRVSLSQVLVAAQIGISLLMLVAAGLFTRTLSNLQSIELGFNSENLLLFRMNARQAGHQDPEIATFYSGLQKRFRSIPGVRAATSSDIPLIGEGTSAGPVLPVGAQPTPGRNPRVLTTGLDFFTTMQIPVLLGRAIDYRDQPGSTPVAVVSEAYVKTHFGDRNPLGQHLTIPRRPPLSEQDVEIVGVVANARYGSLKGEFREIVYLPFSQRSYRPVDDMTFALRTSGDPLQYVKTVRAIVHQADARVPVANVRTQSAQIDQTMNQEIILATLCTAFALLALLIACIGLYGTMAYTVARRAGEIGIRMALGAERGRVVWMVLREAFVLAATGLAVSVPLALGISKSVESFLYGVKPNSPAALVLAVAILLSAVLLAGYIPARKASRIDPMSALRQE
ncbi:MAG: ABC transporter permease [Acidobacteria bacterium]|nr:ABC transporter permease [Acidobacteriota bacterium]